MPDFDVTGLVLVQRQPGRTNAPFQNCGGSQRDRIGNKMLSLQFHFFRHIVYASSVNIIWFSTVHNYGSPGVMYEIFHTPHNGVLIDWDIDGIRVIVLIFERRNSVIGHD